MALKFQQQLLSKVATNGGHGENSPYFDGWKAYDSDPYHPTENPQGVIQMGLAENQLCFDLIQQWIMNNPRASISTAEGVTNFKDIAIFQDYHGLPEFREAIAKFMAKVRGDRVTFDPDRVVMSGGATGAHEMMAFCLADPGDAFLVPTPYYPGKMLAARHGIFTRGLMQVRIGNLGGNAGLFCWMDLRRLLKEPTFEAEMVLWRVIINEVKLNVSPGSSFHCSEPGWFRVCYANMDDETMRVALRRIKMFVLQENEREMAKKRQMWHNDLQLKLSFRRWDDIMKTPRMLTPHMIMSPHLPLSSPLVRARN